MNFGYVELRLIIEWSRKVPGWLLLASHTNFLFSCREFCLQWFFAVSRMSGKVFVRCYEGKQLQWILRSVCIYDVCCIAHLLYVLGSKQLLTAHKVECEVDLMNNWFWLIIPLSFTESLLCRCAEAELNSVCPKLPCSVLTFLHCISQNVVYNFTVILFTEIQ